MNIAVVLAGGLGQRFGSIVHKQYLKLNGKEVVAYSLERLKACKNINQVLLVVDEIEYKSNYIAQKYNVECVCGGETRNKSVGNALKYIKRHYPQCDRIMFQDATRPLIQTEYFDRCFDEFVDCDCVVSYQEITDSLCDENGKFVDRDTYKLIQTPEVFNFNQLFDIFDANSSKTAIASQLSCPKIRFIKSNYLSFKITYPEDLFLAEQLDQINFTQIKKQKHTKLKNKKILLFGGSGGVGTALQKKLSQFENIKILAPTSQEINLKDVTVQKLQNFCKDFEPDIVINTAAISFNDGDGILETFDDVFAVNLKSNLVIMEFLKSLHKPAKFVTISSSSSTKGRKNITNYSASKSALNSVIESLADEYKKLGIEINAVVPEKIKTPMIQKLHKTNISDRELLSTEEVVDTIIDVCNSEVYGKLIHIRKGL